MPYITLGSRPVTAAADTTSLNPGGYTANFPASVLQATVPYYEIYSLVVTGLPALSNVTVFLNAKARSTAKLLGNSEWDPNQPMLMADGDDLAVCFSVGTGTPPVVTAWLRYDPDLNGVRA